MEKYNIRDLLFEELIELTLEAEDFEDAIKKIGEDAYRKGYVKEGFADAVIKREKLYPTALPTEVLKVAIPHVGMFSEKESMERIKASTTPKEIMNSLIELLS